MLNQRLLLYNGILSMIFHRVRTLSCIEPTTFLANFLLRGAWEIKHYKCGFKKKTSERTVYQSISVCLQIWIFTNASSLIIMPKFLLFFFFFPATLQISQGLASLWCGFKIQALCSCGFVSKAEKVILPL